MTICGRRRLAAGLVTQPGPIDQPYAYTGREWDAELGLYDYRARYYDPEVGRFLSRDPIGLAAGPDPYTCCHVGSNQPTNALDPSVADCATCMCSFDCDIYFDVPDRFRDPLDMEV